MQCMCCCTPLAPFSIAPTPLLQVPLLAEAGPWQAGCSCAPCVSQHLHAECCGGAQAELNLKFRCHACADVMHSCIASGQCAASCSCTAVLPLLGAGHSLLQGAHGSTAPGVLQLWCPQMSAGVPSELGRQALPGSPRLSPRLRAPAGSPLQNFTSYSNVLFGDEQGGDVLAGEPAAAKPQAEAETPRSMSVADKVQQQIALNQQKRLARLQVRLPAG